MLFNIKLLFTGIKKQKNGEQLEQVRSFKEQLLVLPRVSKVGV